MATISHIQPLFQTHVVPLLTAMETRRFSISSKPALEMIQAAAKELQKDVTFPGERVLIKINPSITALLLQKLKMEALSDQSGFFDAINDLKACMKEENVDTEDIQLLFQYSFRSVPHRLARIGSKSAIIHSRFFEDRAIGIGTQKLIGIDDIALIKRKSMQHSQAVEPMFIRLIVDRNNDRSISNQCP
jgi:hypothetical protein